MKRIIALICCLSTVFCFSCKPSSQSEKCMDILFDTDANNELDDQHAIAYLLLNEDSFHILGFTTNATKNGGDIQQHCREAERVIALVGKEKDGIPVLPGANASFEEILPTTTQPDYDGKEAVDFIIKKASEKSPEDKMVLLAVGKLTNVALALYLHPEISENIRLVWLGSNYPEKGEYNLVNDIPAMNYVLNTDVPFEIVTVRYGRPSGTSAVRITKEKAQGTFPGMGPHVSTPVEGRHGGTFTCFGDYSANLFEHISYSDKEQTRALYDMAAAAILKNPSWAEKKTLPAPIMVDKAWEDRPTNSRTISLWENFNSEAIIEDYIETLRRHP